MSVLLCWKALQTLQAGAAQHATTTVLAKCTKTANSSSHAIGVCSCVRHAISSYAALQRRQHTIAGWFIELLSLQAPLVGELGQSTIQKVLSHTENPSNAIREIQIKASLRNPQCRPLLSLLDELGVTRCEAIQPLPL